MRYNKYDVTTKKIKDTIFLFFTYNSVDVSTKFNEKPMIKMENQITKN